MQDEPADLVVVAAHGPVQNDDALVQIVVTPEILQNVGRDRPDRDS